MTDNDTSTETTEVDTTEVVDEPQPGVADLPHPDTEVPDESEPQSKREARYRLQLRETEAERDHLAGRVEALQRAEVERLAAEHLTKPAALWTVGVELASLVGEDGTVDPDRVLTAAQDARHQLGLEDPQAKRKRGPIVPREGTGTHQHNGGNTWEDAFKR